MNKLDLLIISTTLKNILVVLQDEKNKIYTRILTENKSGNYLAKAIKEVVEESKLNIKNLEEFGIDIGPGSFTGIRVAISTLQGLLIDNPEKEVYTFFSSDVLYRSVVNNNHDLKKKKLTVLKRARENAAYASIYEDGKRIFGPQMVFEDFLINSMNNCILINEEAEYFKNKYKLENEVFYSNIEEESLIAETLKGKRVKIKNLEPLYLQKPLAVENLERRKTK
ncbi:MAG TPA: tRNA (adenosine(37)-N6)-threonylcarbamoyltransferase complex dimerization subunit type 1 TsaB [Petrotoga sp.]|nr:MAG: Peptidase M22 glycoprotease [Petrotoga mobilis]HBT51206.1 tRNA (adenosine(37)-N6)-threonylcarbamoyltransferase complex dimerization subunit type 1 TsaB [Petrotoga sp.]